MIDFEELQAEAGVPGRDFPRARKRHPVAILDGHRPIMYLLLATARRKTCGWQHEKDQTQPARHPVVFMVDAVTARFVAQAMAHVAKWL